MLSYVLVSLFPCCARLSKCLAPLALEGSTRVHVFFVPVAFQIEG